MKIMIMGSSGAGKSTFARTLGKLYDISVFHLDQCFWKPNWEMSTLDEQTEIHSKLIANEDWVIDGNYTRFFEERSGHADKVIFLNISRWRCFYRVLKRYVLYRGKTRPDMRDGCEEKVDWEFLVWIWNYHSKKKHKIITKLKSIEDKEIVILNGAKSVNAYLNKLNEENDHE